jgi:acetyl-CoA decarbonylase/synthase complex subunit delta
MIHPDRSVILTFPFHLVDHEQRYVPKGQMRMSGLAVEKYAGKIREIRIGKPGTELIVGGETAYAFHLFEGTNPNPPKLGLQVLDVQPEEWASAAIEPFKDVCHDPVAWAKKCTEEYGADFVCLWLFGTDPNGQDLSPEHAAEVAKRVGEAIDVPLIVWGVSNNDKNRETLKAVCESCAGMNLAVGPVTENNYKQIGAAAIAYKHVVIANSPIDINLAKQLNILLETLGIPENGIIIDPTTSSVGYGMEYCYSIMERIRQAALCQNDDKLQYPILNNIAEEVWKVKEAKLPEQENPKLGDAIIRGINLEAITAVSTLNAGSDILILRHPETLKHIRKYVSDMMIETDLESMDIDLLLTIGTETKPTPAPQPTAAAKAVPSTGVPPKPPDKVTQAPTPKTKPAPSAKPAQPAKVPTKPPNQVTQEPGEAPETAKLQPKEKPAEPPEPKPAVGETPVAEPIRIPSEKPELSLTAEPPSSGEDEGAGAFTATLQEMDIPDDELDRFRTALSVWRSIQALEKKVGEAEKTGVPLENLDFSDDEICSYHEVQSLGKALHVIELKIEEAEKLGREVHELDFLEADLLHLRSGLAVLKEKGIREARRIAKEHVVEVDLPEEDLETLREMLGLYRAAKRVVLGIKKLLQGEVA